MLFTGKERNCGMSHNGILFQKNKQTKNALLHHEKTERKLKYTLLREKSQSEKATYYMISSVWHSTKGKTTDTVKRSVVTGVYGEREKN